MNKTVHDKPVILALSAHDPSGGAGIQADIETMSAHGCMAAPVITSLTAQNTQSFAYHIPQTRGNFITQTKLLIDDMDIAACKIGAIGCPQLIRATHEIISRNSFPVVLDPVFQSTTGHDFADQETYLLIRELLLPFTTVVTPNRHEASVLSGVPASRAAAELLETGCKYVLITDTEPSSAQVVNRLYRRHEPCTSYYWQRLEGGYHGSGCTLAAAVSAGLAKKTNVETAVEQAQEFTWGSIKHAVRTGRGQLCPNRFFRMT